MNFENYVGLKPNLENPEQIINLLKQLIKFSDLDSKEFSQKLIKSYISLQKAIFPKISHFILDFEKINKMIIQKFKDLEKINKI